MGFRPMRRRGQMLPESECEAVLRRNTAGVLAVLGDGGYPYAVPLSYVYDRGSLYFHCAITGHKLDAVSACEKASFCVIDQDQVVPAEYTTYYRSVIAFGRVRILEDPAEVRSAIEKLAVKYAPEDSPENREAAIQKELAGLAMLRLDVGHMTGKEARELARQRKAEEKDG